MKTISLIRHAKSGQKDDPAIRDFDRGLNDRGEKEAAWAGQQAKALDLQVLIASPAKRALDTAKAVAKAIHYPPAKILTDMTMYASTPGTLLKIIKNIDDKYDRAAIFGHNPEFTHLLCDLCVEEQGEMPTGSIGCLQFDVDSWKKIANKKGRLIMVAAPPRN